jgi:hypothetical protein
MTAEQYRKRERLFLAIKDLFQSAYDHLPRELKAQMPKCPRDIRDILKWPLHWDDGLCLRVAHGKIARGIKSDSIFTEPNPVRTAGYIEKAILDFYSHMLCEKCGARPRVNPRVPPPACSCGGRLISNERKEQTECRQRRLRND